MCDPVKFRVLHTERRFYKGFLGRDSGTGGTPTTVCGMKKIDPLQIRKYEVKDTAHSQNHDIPV